MTVIIIIFILGIVALFIDYLMNKKITNMAVGVSIPLFMALIVSMILINTLPSAGQFENMLLGLCASLLALQMLIVLINIIKTFFTQKEAQPKKQSITPEPEIAQAEAEDIEVAQAQTEDIIEKTKQSEPLPAEDVLLDEIFTDLYNQIEKAEEPAELPEELPEDLPEEAQADPIIEYPQAEEPAHSAPPQEEEITDISPNEPTPSELDITPAPPEEPEAPVPHEPEQIEISPAASPEEPEELAVEPASPPPAPVEAENIAPPAQETQEAQEIDTPVPAEQGKSNISQAFEYKKSGSWSKALEFFEAELRGCNDDTIKKQINFQIIDMLMRSDKKVAALNKIYEMQTAEYDFSEVELLNLQSMLTELSSS